MALGPGPTIIHLQHMSALDSRVYNLSAHMSESTGLLAQ